MSKILVIGDIYFETQYFVEKIPLEDEFSIASSATNIIGSKTINVSRVLSKKGNSIYFYGKVGDNEFGEIAKTILRKTYTLNTKYIFTVLNSQTGQISLVTNSDGKSSITLNLAANKLFNQEDISRFKKIVIDFDLVYCATNLPLNLLYLIVEECSIKNISVFIDIPNQHKLIKLKKLNNATFIAPNRQEAELLLNTKINTLEDAKHACLEIRKSYQGIILITLDKDGCIILEKENELPVHYKAEKVDIIDVAGSGDIFRAVFVDSWLKYNNIDKAIRIALKTASESVKIRGVDNTIDSLNFNISNNE